MVKIGRFGIGVELLTHGAAKASTPLTVSDKTLDEMAASDPRGYLATLDSLCMAMRRKRYASWDEGEGLVRIIGEHAAEDCRVTWHATFSVDGALIDAWSESRRWPSLRRWFDLDKVKRSKKFR